MTFQITKEILIRDYVESDIDVIRRLPLKLGDQIEISKLTNMGYLEYLEWHINNFLHCTKVLVYKGKIIGILGIEEDTKVLFFLTIDIPREIRSVFIRHFKVSIEFLLDSINSTECYILIDVDYTTSYNWAKRYGFVTIEKSQSNSLNIEIMKYTKS